MGSNICQSCKEVFLGIGSAIERRRYTVTSSFIGWAHTLGIGSANERRRYIVTSSLIGWAHTKNELVYIVWMHKLDKLESRTDGTAGCQ